MKKKLICLLVAGALPGLALADSTSEQIKALQAQLNALQKEVKSLRNFLKQVLAHSEATPLPIHSKALTALARFRQRQRRRSSISPRPTTARRRRTSPTIRSTR